MKLFKNIFSEKKVLVTGHTGFKGAWLSFWLNKLGAHVTGYSLPENNSPATYTALEVKKILSDEVLENICDYQKFKEHLFKTKPEFIFHLAAQSLVRYSYRYPLETIQSNFLGTTHVLEALREYSSFNKKCVCIIVTSDKCYQNQEKDYAYQESDAMGGNDIYSMSKGACELLVHAYRQSFFQNHIFIASARAGNVIGGGDFAEDRILPDCVRSIMQEKTLSIRNPKSIRPWQHVLEPLSGYLHLASIIWKNESKEFCSGWNFGPLSEQNITVQNVVELFFKFWGKGTYSMQELNNKMHEAHLLKLDIQKAHNYLSWQPQWNTEYAILKTVEWYKAFCEKKISMTEFSYQQIMEYEKDVKYV